MLTSDVTRSSKVHVKIYDELDSDEEDPAFIGEVEVNIADLFMSPLKDEGLCYLFTSPRMPLQDSCYPFS